MTPTDGTMNRRGLLASLAAVLAVPATLRASAQGPKREVVIVEKATEALIEISQIPAKAIPLDLLRRRTGS